MNSSKYKTYNWFFSRKYILSSLTIDLILLSTFHKRTFVINQTSFLQNYLYISLFLLIIINYLIGRYTPEIMKIKKIIIKHFFISCKLFFLLNFSLVFLSYFSKLNFLLFLNEIRIIFIFSIVSGLAHCFHEIIRTFRNKYIWLYVGNNEELIFLKNLLKTNNKYESIYHLPLDKFLSLKSFDQYAGVIISDKFENESHSSIIKKFRVNRSGISVYGVLSWCKIYLNRIPSLLLEEPEDFKKIVFKKNLLFEMKLKRFIDCLFSIIILTLSFPILIISMIIIYFQDRGPLLYTQIRTGINGETFKIYKLRTMSADAEIQGAQWSQRNDKRVTKFGNLLRRTRVDELPQLINVLKGEMSLIGPRPERPEIEETKLNELKNYNLRYIFKPGLSGWSQVNYCYGASVEDADIKLSYDLFYIANFSLFLDIIIFFKTIKLILNAKGSKPNN